MDQKLHDCGLVMPYDIVVNIGSGVAWWHQAII